MQGFYAIRRPFPARLAQSIQLLSESREHRYNAEVSKAYGEAKEPTAISKAERFVMIFSRQLPLTSLIDTCRVLRHNLSAGLSLVDVFRQLARKGPLRVRPIAERIRQQVERGESLEDALQPDRAAFPPLFMAMAVVGEQSGNLPEVFGELERYFVLQLQLKRQFWGQIAWPLFQLIAGIFVIAGMIWLIGILSPVTSQPWDPLGLGLTGTGGAIAFLCICFGTLAAIVLGYMVLTRTLKQKAAVDAFLLRIPVIGPCLMALALTRFCLALRLTTETGMSITRAMRLTLRATSNAAFEARSNVVEDGLKHGDDLTVALTSAGLFPQQFLHIVAVAEEAGRLSEVMKHQAEHYQEESSRRLTILTQVTAWGVYGLVALLLIIVIFRIALTYIGMLDPAKYGMPGG